MSQQFSETNEPTSQRRIGNAIDYSASVQEAMRYNKLRSSEYPLVWQHLGMQAPVKVNSIEIASLLDLGQRGSDDILRRVQIKLFERAALETIHARADLKAVMWSPVDVVQPQEFLNLWIITLETDERIPIIESIKNGQRVYEHYQFDGHNEQKLPKLSEPAS